MNRMSDSSVNGSANQSSDSDVPCISSIFNRLANAKGTQENERFQLNEPVEETKDLIAAHNVDADKLNKMFDYDGIPTPSIAITKAEFRIKTLEQKYLYLSLTNTQKKEPFRLIGKVLKSNYSVLIVNPFKNHGSLDFIPT